jgi:hypothetical protein
MTALIVIALVAGIVLCVALGPYVYLLFNWSEDQ